jgi:hypothetical protein
VASAAQGSVAEAEIWWRALALGVYVLSISYLARGESGAARARRWTGLLFVPVFIALVREWPAIPAPVWVAAAMLGTWIGFCLSKSMVLQRVNFGRGVAGLLAGVVLVDWLAIAGTPQPPGLVFGLLFCLALVLQRVAPAT